VFSWIVPVSYVFYCKELVPGRKYPKAGIHKVYFKRSVCIHPSANSDTRVLVLVQCRYGTRVQILNPCSRVLEYFMAGKSNFTVLEHVPVLDL